MKKQKLLIGEKFNRLTVVSETAKGWLFRCDCGKEIDLEGSRVTSSKPTQSCGCARSDHEARYRHGLHNTPTYVSWRGMIDRCTNPNNKDYKHYGARGITVCEAWKTFANFAIDMGVRPEGLTLERINNDLEYCKENCKWDTQQNQVMNSRHNVYVSVFGQSVCLSEAARILDISAGALYQRHYRHGQENLDAYVTRVQVSRSRNQQE